MSEISIERALAIAIVRCGMSIEDFSSLRISEWTAIMEELDSLEKHQYRDQWEQCRQISFSSLLPHLPEGSTLTKSFPLPWDEVELEQEKGIPTSEDLENMKRRFNVE